MPNALLHEAVDRLESLILVLEFGAVSNQERNELIRKAKITVEHLRLQERASILID